MKFKEVFFVFLLCILIIPTNGKLFAKSDIPLSKLIDIVKEDKLFLEKIIETMQYKSFTVKDVAKISHNIELVEDGLLKVKNQISDKVLLSQISEALYSIENAKVILAKLNGIIKSNSHMKLYKELINLEENLYELEVYITGLNIYSSRK